MAKNGKSNGKKTAKSNLRFTGWRRENGRVGVRNHVIILPLDDLSNAACEAVGNNIKGTLALPLRPETRLQMIAVDDIGAFVAMAFEKPGHWQDQTRELAGDELSMEELTERLGRASGRPVRYQQVPWDDWERQVGHELTVMWRWFEEHGYHVDTALVRQEYPQLTGFDRWLSQHWLLRRTA